MPLVKLVNVSKYYGRIKALDNVSLEVEDGEYVCVIGPSGSGKSTLLKVIAGIVKPSRGEVYIDDVLVNDVPVGERGIGLVAQDILLFPHMTVWSNITYGPLVQGLPLEQVEDIGETVVASMGLKLRKKAYPDELSRGSQQKVAIARAIAAGAKLLLLDEPLGSIDPRAAKALRYELRRLVKDLKLTAIHVTHNQEEALSIADKVVVLRNGRIEQVGSPADLYFNPKSLFVVRFIGGEANFLEGVVYRENPLLIKAGPFEIQADKPDLTLGERVVVAVRPENVSIEAGSTGSASGKIVDVSFLEKYLRVVVEVEGCELIAKISRNEGYWARPGVEVSIRVRKAHVFKYPKEGLEKAIAFE